MSPVLHRPKSSLGLRTEQDLGSNPLVTVPFGSMTRGKSLPSIHIDVTAQGETATRDEQDQLRDEVELRRERHNSSMEHLQRPSAAPPTITVTEHSPVSSIQFFLNQVGRFITNVQLALIIHVLRLSYIYMSNEGRFASTSVSITLVHHSRQYMQSIITKRLLLTFFRELIIHTCVGERRLPKR